MRAGDLDRKVTLHGPDVEGYNEWNEPIFEPGPTYEVRAQYLPVSDAEKLAAAQVQATLTARFIVRWAPSLQGLNAMWKVTFEGREFDATGVKEIGRREGFEISAAARSDV